MMPIEAHCGAIAAIAADYRAGEVPPIDTAHVLRWIEQFPAGIRDPLSAEVAHILTQTYASEVKVRAFLKMLVNDRGIVGDDPPTFWRGVSFLHLQTVGSSQHDMLALFDQVLQAETGISVRQCGTNPHTYVYLDDAVYSGGRVKSDLVGWINNAAPPHAKVLVIAMAIHTLGRYFATNDIADAARAAGKTVDLNWSWQTTFEDRKAYMSNSDVLRPTHIPAKAEAYVDTLSREQVLRTGQKIGDLGLFTSSAGRELIEQQFLKRGVEVRDQCPLLPQQMRPLGGTLMHTTGFGTLFVTYRNCANNAPLVFWAGNPWYPLFRRRTN